MNPNSATVGFLITLISNGTSVFASKESRKIRKFQPCQRRFNRNASHGRQDRFIIGGTEQSKA